MSTPRKPSRPRLEVTTRSNIASRWSSVGLKLCFWVTPADRVDETPAIGLADMKRLHAFLGKAIAYLESQRKGGRK